VKKIAVFAGSFDPFTKGHESVVVRALPLFDKIIIAIGENSTKMGFLSIEERIELINNVFKSESKVEVAAYEGLTVDYCKKVNANYMLRGIRTASDFEYERGVAQMNKLMLPNVESFFLLTTPELTPVNSTIVRDILRHGGDVSQFLPDTADIYELLQKRNKRKELSMDKKLFGVLFFIASFYFCKAETVPTTLYGNNIEYAGQIIKVCKFSDYISKQFEIISLDTVDENGDFSLSYFQNETLLLNIPLGIYEAIIYTEPARNYQVVLPPFQQKTKADVLNPFFMPVQVYLGIKNADSMELNYMIANFNELYSNYIDANYYSIYRNPRKASVDSVINQIENNFSSNLNGFFKDYREYKYAWLKYLSYMRDTRYVIREYYHNKPFLYQNPAYMDLFNQLFANYLTLYMNTKEGERLYSDIAFAKSPKYIKQTFSNNMVLLNDTLQELVLLKGLNDAFSQSNFPLSNLLITLDSVAITSNVPIHKKIAENINKKVLQARKGFPAPRFELRDANGIFRKSSDYLANYVYLNFISLESFSCQQDLEMLKMLYEKHKTDFRIVSICIDDDFEKAVKYFKTNGYEWMLLSYKSQKSIVDDYKVRGYPTYYLINPEGKLSMSPAVSPSENFELAFFKMMQALKKAP